MTPETELAVALCRTPASEHSLERARSVVAPGFDWNAFFDYTARGQVEPVTLTNIQQLAPEIPAVALERAKACARDARAVSLSKALVTGELLSTFEKAGIPVIVLKGAASALTCYGDVSLRRFGDIDLLVRSEDAHRARLVLVSAGYSPLYLIAAEDRLLSAGHALELSNGASKVELHVDLISRHLGLEFDHEMAWSSSRLLSWAGREMRVLDTEVEFLFLCAHGAKHEWMQLRWLTDVAQLSDRLSESDAKNVVALAARMHAVKLLRTTLQLIELVFGRLPDSEVLRAAARGKVSSYVVQSVMRNLELNRGSRGEPLSLSERMHPGLSSLRFWVGTRERVRDRMSCITNVLLRSTAPEDIQSGRWIPRPIRLVVRAARRAAATS